MSESNFYRCPQCAKISIRESEDAWVQDYCTLIGGRVRMAKIAEADYAYHGIRVVRTTDEVQP
jgi:hypothetical protein